MTDPMIVRRLDAAIAKAGELGATVRAVHLTEADWALLTRWSTRVWRRKLHSRAVFTPCSYRDHPICTGRRTLISTDHGVAVTVPRRA